LILDLGRGGIARRGILEVGMGKEGQEEEDSRNDNK
jgi:hypothetical protein